LLVSLTDLSDLDYMAAFGDPWKRNFGIPERRDVAGVNRPVVEE
jgi:hypothetical protein